jgi:hypothetical protein
MQNAHGLVVGIANYLHVNSLPEIILQDAMAVHAVLTNPGYCAYPVGNVDRLLDEEATQERLLHALNKLTRQCDEESTVFIYLEPWRPENIRRVCRGIPLAGRCHQ